MAATGSKVIDKITMNYESNFEFNTSTNTPKVYAFSKISKDEYNSPSLCSQSCFDN